jgi:hypothetical protein
MSEKIFFKVRLYFTGIVTIVMWTLLAWSHYHGGVPSLNILHREDLPAISNWWGGLLLPLLTWFLLYRIKKRTNRGNSGKSEIPKYSINILYGFVGALIFGILLSAFFMIEYSYLANYMVLGLFPLALVFPIYRAEYLLGFVIGMTYTFGVVLPTAFGSLIALAAVVLYLYVRPIILNIASRFKP